MWTQASSFFKKPILWKASTPESPVLTTLKLLAFILPLAIIFCCLFEQIGPNVSISANVRVGAGVRLISCIILDDIEIKVTNVMSKSVNDMFYFLYTTFNRLLSYKSKNNNRMLSWQENAVIINSIVGWKSSIGKWSRVQASPVMCLSCSDLTFPWDCSKEPVMLIVDI